MKRLYLPILFFLISSCTNSIKIYYSQEHTIADGQPISRSQVVLTADKYARVHWFMNDVNVKGIGCSNSFKSDYSTGPRIGMGYKFGGWDSIDTFLNKISEGCGTGTGVEDYKNLPFDCVTGISCTGLVSRAWHLNHKYTLTYPDQPEVPRQFHEISNWVNNVNFLFENAGDLKKGDAFINRSHIMIFLYENRDGNPMIIHSAVGGVSFEEISWFGLWRHGYIPIKYNNILDEHNPAGTVKNPIVIDSESFPFIHEGNTRNVVSMEFDGYSASSEINQQGPETIFTLNLLSNKTVVIQINDLKAEGIDNDVHLLTSLKKDSKKFAIDCLVRNDRKIEIQLDAGTYYIIVDSNKDIPGEYKLLVNTL